MAKYTSNIKVFDISSVVKNSFFYTLFKLVFQFHYLLYI